MSCGVVSWATTRAPVGASRASSARSVLATTLSLSPAAASRRPRHAAAGTAQRRPRAIPSASSAASSVPSRVEKGMILTVATMSPSSTARCGGKVATVIASSIALTRSIAPASTIASPAASANRLTRPVNAGAQRDCAPASRSASAQRPPRPRRRPRLRGGPQRLRARPRRRAPAALRRDDVALLERHPVDPDGMRENGAFRLARWEPAPNFMRADSRSATASCAAPRRFRRGSRRRSRPG